MKAIAPASAITLSHINKRFGAVQANNDVSLDVERGTIHGIVGENGAGKSTLMSILFGFYQADSGEIFIAGADVRVVALASLRSSVCYLPAQPILFHRSIADNLRIGRFDSTCDERDQTASFLETQQRLFRWRWSGGRNHWQAQIKSPSAQPSPRASPR